MLDENCIIMKCMKYEECEAYVVVYNVEFQNITKTWDNAPYLSGNLSKKLQHEKDKPYSNNHIIMKCI